MINDRRAWYDGWAVVKTFPGHRGRPGQRGGSLPRGATGPVQATWKVSDDVYQEAFGRVAREEVEAAFALPGANTQLWIDEEGPGVRIMCTWRDSETGEEIGNCGRQLEQGLDFTGDPNEPPRIYKRWTASYLNFRRGFQNKGHATSLYERQVELAKKAGFERMETNATGTIGRYAWSKRGYDYTDKAHAAKATKDFGQWITRHDIDLPKEQWPTFTSASSVGSFRIPGLKFVPRKHMAFSNFDVPADMELDLGKAFMLDMGGYGHGPWRATLDLRK